MNEKKRKKEAPTGKKGDVGIQTVEREV